MSFISLLLSPRFITLTLMIIGTALLAVAIALWPDLTPYLILPLVIFAFLSLLGVRDLLQKRHATLRTIRSRPMHASCWSAYARRCANTS
jgi:hypothetical protein